MNLDSGTRLGRYEIQNHIGTGGMGEVYRALDTELHRAVALKFLRSEVAADEKRMQRFIQEARSASALNHPNILTIYEIGQAEGVRFFSTEFVDGVTVRAALANRKMKLIEVLDVAIQVASALAAAHAAGIVHRDIKPENIMLRRDGYVKVLDFGLAKVIDRSPSSVDMEAATQALVNTDPGAVMGTVSYMSPEQASAKEVDGRTDIWSLGCVLYEMVTGHVPFEGETTSHVIVAILEKEPLPLSHYVEGVPEALEWIVTEALTKDREERTQSARELLKKLQRLKQRVDAEDELDRSVAPNLLRSTGGAGGATASGASQNMHPTLTKTITAEHMAALPGEVSAKVTNVSSAEYVVNQVKSHKKGVMLALAVLIVAGLAFGIYKFASRDETPAIAKQMKISRLVTGVGELGNVSVSPDGKYVAYVMYKEDKVSIRVKQVSTGSDREIVAPMADAGIAGTVFSPDGELIYYNNNDREKSPLGTLYQVPVIGGREPKKILEHLSSIVSFAPDGKRFAFFRDFSKTGDSALMVGNVEGGEPRILAKRGGNDWFFGVPAWSPDGRIIACPAATDTGGTQFTVVEVPAEGGAEKPITSHKWRGEIHRSIWLKDGSGLILNGKELPTSPIQIWHLSYPDGAVTRITNDLTEYGSSSFGLTADSSTIVTIASEESTKIWVAAPNADVGSAKKLTNGKYDGQAGLDWTPDGRVVYVTKTGDYSDIWMMNADGTGQKQLTSNADSESGVRVSPDGRYIVFTSAAVGGLQHVWRMDVDGGNLKQLTQGEFVDFAPFFSPDGQWVVFGSWKSGNPRMWKVSVNGGEQAQLSDLPFNASAFLSDGKLIFGGYYDEQVSPPRWRSALMSFESGQVVKVFDFPPKTNGWKMLDERTLLYSKADNEVHNIWTQPLEGGAPKQLTKFTSERIYNFAPSRDGKQFALVRGTSSADIILIKDFR
ncbi:MAG: protein kinase [Acidobacteria bacterium]|nr:protein kinase [Acidobacteriota bacterium]